MNDKTTTESKDAIEEYSQLELIGMWYVDSSLVLTKERYCGEVVKKIGIDSYLVTTGSFCYDRTHNLTFFEDDCAYRVMHLTSLNHWFFYPDQSDAIHGENAISLVELDKE